jgi:methyltransferase (TIGR00027 family)
VFRETAIDTVVNLGAGLDTRPYRLPLPAMTRWIEIDNPEVLAYKTQVLEGYAPMCQLESLSLDVVNVDHRLALCRRISASSKNVLIIAEGLLVYLASAQVASLARDLSACSPFQYWVCDLVSPNLFRLARETSTFTVDSANATMLFAPETGAEFFREFGWEATTCRWSLEEGRRLERRFVPDSVLAELSGEQRDALGRLNAVVTLKRTEARRTT